MELITFAVETLHLRPNSGPFNSKMQTGPLIQAYTLNQDNGK